MMEKLLIVDDNPAVRKMLRITLSYGKYFLLEAENGQQALDLIEQEHPDIVLLDIMMSQIDGLEVCRRIKSNPENANCFVVMLTALGDSSSMDLAKAYQADVYLNKPFALSSLIEVIEGCRHGKSSADQTVENQQAIGLRINNTMLPDDLK